MTITLTREEAQQVLDALECMNEGAFNAEIKLLRARLAQPEPPCKTGSQCIGGKCPQCVVEEPEPVADKYLMEVECTKCGAKQDGILTVNAPPRREWQGLTDEEYETMAEHYVTNCYFDTLKYARAIEAKLKEKNT